MCIMGNFPAKELKVLCTTAKYSLVNWGVINGFHKVYCLVYFMNAISCLCIILVKQVLEVTHKITFCATSTSDARNNLHILKFKL